MESCSDGALIGANTAAVFSLFEIQAETKSQSNDSEPVGVLLVMVMKLEFLLRLVIHRWTAHWREPWIPQIQFDLTDWIKSSTLTPRRGSHRTKSNGARHPHEHQSRAISTTGAELNMISPCLLRMRGPVCGCVCWPAAGTDGWAGWLPQHRLDLSDFWHFFLFVCELQTVSGNQWPVMRVSGIFVSTATKLN